MDVITLVCQGENEPVALSCGKCGHIWGLTLPDAAEDCCKPRICACGVPIDPPYYKKCRSCRQKDDVEKERLKFEKAEKIPLSEYTGEYLYHEGFSNEGYAQAEYVTSELEDLEIETGSRPDYAWACDPWPCPRIDAQDMIEGLIDDYHEGAIESLDIDGLQKLCDEWLEKQPTGLSFFATDKAVILTDTDARNCDTEEE